MDWLLVCFMGLLADLLYGLVCWFVCHFCNKGLFAFLFYGFVYFLLFGVVCCFVIWVCLVVCYLGLFAEL